MPRVVKMSFKIKMTKIAKKDQLKVFAITALKRKAEDIKKLLETNPFQYPPEYEKLEGDFKGLYSRRLNIQHRLVYQVYKKEKIVKIISMWTHYQ